MGWWHRYLRWRQRHVVRLSLTAEGFDRIFRSEAATIRWIDIREIVAFKRDLATVDLICLAIATETTAIEIDEDMPGYTEIEDALHARLGISSAWKLAVMLPAFDTNPTRIFPATPQPSCLSKPAAA